MALSFTVAAEQAATATLLVSFLQAVGTGGAVNVASGATTSATVDGATLTEFNTIIRAAASHAGAASALGTDASSKALVSQWLSAARGSVSLADVNAALADRTFLAGGSQMTVADVAVYAAVHAQVAAAANLKQTPHVARWFDLVQHRVAGLAGALPAVAGLHPGAGFAWVAVEAPVAGAAAGGAAPAAGTAAGKPAKSAKVAAGSKAAAAAGAAAAGAAGAEAPVTAAAPAPVAAAAPAAPAAGKKAAAAAAADAPKKGGDAAAAGKKGGDAKPAAGAKKDSKEDDEEGDDNRSPMSECQFLIGRVLSAEKHPGADKLLLEKIDVGEPEPRTIVSGLVGHVQPQDLVGKLVVVAANLKAKPFAGVQSVGMLVCASTEDKSKVEVLVVPEGAKVGEAITVAGHTGKPALPSRMTKKKILEKTLPDLSTNDERVVVYKGVPLMTTAGAIAAPTLVKAHVG